MVIPKERSKLLPMAAAIGRSRLFQIFLVLGSACMILLVIMYWDEMGTSHYYRHTPVCPRHHQQNQTSHVAAELQQRQEQRRRLLQEMCAEDSMWFPGKNTSFDDIPNKALDHLIVDDRHGIIYCYVPKVACTNWKQRMIILSQSMLQDGVPYTDPQAIPKKTIHNINSHLTLDKFWHRDGKFSHRQMKVKLKKYTKFLFVRDPFVRLISAFRNKFLKTNDSFYKRFAQSMLRRYGNQPTPPASVSEAFTAGIYPTFSQFVQYLLDPETEKQEPFEEHWRQAYRLCHPCQIQYDFVGHLETVDEDSKHLLRQLGVDNIVDFPAAHGNGSTGYSLADWFSTVPLEARRQLYKLYEPDFRLFGYERPDSVLDE